MYVGIDCCTLLLFVVGCTKHFCIQSNSEYSMSLAYVHLSKTRDFKGMKMTAAGWGGDGDKISVLQMTTTVGTEMQMCPRSAL